jgi:uncharacterized protein (DUF58 family)
MTPGAGRGRWRPSVRTRQLATAALLALVAAVASGHAQLLLLAAPVLGALAMLSRERPGGDVTVHAHVSGARCFEGEDVVVSVTADLAGADEVTLELVAVASAVVLDGAAVQAFAGGPATARWVLRPGRWGRYSPGTVAVTSRSGAWESSVACVLDPLDVFPRASRVRPRLVPAELLRRIGDHTRRAAGEGVEFAGIRPYVPGDQLRDLNRAVSIRRGQLHVNQRIAARAADLVVMIDSFTDVGPPGDSTLDVAVHGAAALTTAYLRTGDRVGLVVLGGLLRWLGPAGSDRQFYRIADTMLRARYESFVTPDVGRIPQTALPPGTLIVAFSPLLSADVLTAFTDLRRRGFPLLVVDTLRHEPPVSSRSVPSRSARSVPSRSASPRLTADGLALRLWRLDRAATRARLAGLGVPVLSWEGGAELDGVLAPFASGSASGRPRLAGRP